MAILQYAYGVADLGTCVVWAWVNYALLLRWYCQGIVECMFFGTSLNLRDAFSTSLVLFAEEHSTRGLGSLLSSSVNPPCVDARRAPECWPFVHMWALTCCRDGSWVSWHSQLLEWTLKTLRHFASGLKASFIAVIPFPPLLGSSGAEAARCLFQGSITKSMWYC